MSKTKAPASAAPSGACTLTLEQELNIYHAAELKQQLLQQLAGCESLELDLAGVEEMDSSGLQLLLVLEREARLAHKSLRFLNHSAAVREVLELLHLESHFGDPIVELAGEQRA